MADKPSTDLKGHETKPDLIPGNLFFIPISNLIIYPGMIFPLMIVNDVSMKSVEESLNSERIVGVIGIIDNHSDEIREDGLYTVGVAARIVKMLKMPEGGMNILLQGIARIKVEQFLQVSPSVKGIISVLDEPSEKSLQVEAYMRNIVEKLKKVVSMKKIPPEILITAINTDDPGRLSDLVAFSLDLKMSERQEILEILNATDRLKKVTEFLSRELEINEIENKIQSKLKEKIDKSQKDYFLRQQLEIIKRELGDEDEKDAEIKEFGRKIKDAKMTREAEEVAFKEMERLSKMPPASAEAVVSRTYLDWLLSLPWASVTEDNLDIKLARKILNREHYGLEKVKDRILEYLGVRKLKKDMKGPILCFVGPPGVGKTSLGQSIARSMNRKFARMSLGGVRDEAEIRGHRRTYIGSLPGRIIQGIKKSGTNNPVFMLDEVDKLGIDFRGDPSSALLEVLDPEQNHSFTDHYIEVAFNLSNVMFITTANFLDPIPPALLDRMEVIWMPGYTLEEKLEIAKRHLVPKEIENNGLKDYKIKFLDAAIRNIIRYYTREAGLRNLQRNISKIMRVIAKKIAEGEKYKSTVRPMDLNTYLGVPIFKMDSIIRKPKPGEAIGLAWTPHGGEILTIEALTLPGDGKLILTGQLGDVMKESAQAAFSYVRKQAKALSIQEDFYKKYDVHLHIPEGAIPKDGPSAGITMATALISALTQKAIKPKFAMTGEITLLGRVLPVGGIREKILAARHAGIENIIISKDNQKELTKIPDKLKKGMKFIAVKSMAEVVKAIF